MLSYILRRVLLMFPTLLGITAVVFFIMAYSPGGVGQSLMRGENLKPEVRQAMEKYYNRRFGLNKPKPVQYVHWLNEISPIGFTVDDNGNFLHFGFKRPDLGTSMAKDRPVLSVVAEALPVTLLLNVITIPIVYIVAIATGIIAAQKRGQIADVGGGLVLLILYSLPTIWVGVMVIGFLANKHYIDWFPAAGLHGLRADDMTFLPSRGPQGTSPGWLLDTLWHLVLPIIALSYGGFAVLSKIARGAMLENLQADFVRTAIAKGVPPNRVIFSHVFRNALLPLITVAASILPGLFAGAFVVENIFSIPGMGKLMVDASFTHDRELVMAEALVAGFIGLLSLLIADIGYAIADPRVSYE